MLDWNKPLVFIIKDEKYPARLLCKDLKSAVSLDGEPLNHVLAYDRGDHESTIHCTVSGRTTNSTNFRAENVPERETRWVNIYYNGAGLQHPSIEESFRNRIVGCESSLLKLSYEDGKLVNVEIYKGDE